MPKIKAGSLTEHRAQVRARLFGALSRLMHERGFEAITMADIAAEAGVGRTAVYNHFADKEMLLLAFVNQETQRYIAELEAALDGVTDPVEKLRRYVRKQARLTSVYHLPPGADYRSILSRSALKRMGEHAQVFSEILRSIIEDGIALAEFPPQDVDAVLTLINASINGQRFPESGPELERASNAAELFVLRAVGASDAAAERTNPELASAEN
ncbi:MAG TPA: TetR/AcrR family transcriptional regulator [Actinomycetales bacterium]|nr:TetR/AcrR family transcriptional regulator [Actinomycetales bacterium]